MHEIENMQQNTHIIKFHLSMNFLKYAHMDRQGVCSKEEKWLSGRKKLESDKRKRWGNEHI